MSRPTAIFSISSPNFELTNDIFFGVVEVPSLIVILSSVVNDFL